MNGPSLRDATTSLLAAGIGGLTSNEGPEVAHT